MGRDVEAGDAGPSRRWTEQRGEHPDGGGLAGSVGPQEAEDLALAHREVDPVHGDDLARELLAKALRLDGDHAAGHCCMDPAPRQGPGGAP